MSHFHAPPGEHVRPGDNTPCRCGIHAGNQIPACDGCTYECWMCERQRILEARLKERGDLRPLPGEEKRLKEEKRAASIARGGCGCRSYTTRAMKQFGVTF